MSKHRCLDCGATVRVARHETWKASRPRCMSCGSPRLEVWTKNDPRLASRALRIAEGTERPEPEGEQPAEQHTEAVQEHAPQCTDLLNESLARWANSQ